MAKDDIDTIQTWGKKVRYLGSAHSGTSAARRMHLTSVALVPLTIAFVWIVARISHLDRNPKLSPWAAASAEFGGRPCPTILMLLFIGASIWHMQLGMQVIIDDYVHDRHLKEWALIANTLLCVVLGVACAYALLNVGFGPLWISANNGATF